VIPSTHYSPLAEAVDTHVHTSPDVLPRRQWDRDAVNAAADARMAAIVIKSHTSPTSPRAAIANQQQDAVWVVGGVVLNHAVGGINPEAVRVSLAHGGKIVWMPTLCADNHIRYMRSGVSDQHLAALTSCIACNHAPIQIRGAGGSLLPEVVSVLDLIAESDAVLATGHLAAEESALLIRTARSRKVTRILVTHPEAPQIRMPRELQIELADAGATFERCYYSILDGHITPETMLENARATGPGGTVLATDLGQSHNPLPVDGLTAFREALHAVGMTDDEWGDFACRNGRRLVDLASKTGS
jgi:hypothetical protein